MFQLSLNAQTLLLLQHWTHHRHILSRQLRFLFLNSYCNYLRFVQNAAQCVVSVKAYTSTNNVNITISASFTGNDAFVKLVETRTQESVTLVLRLKVYLNKITVSVRSFNFSFLVPKKI